MNSLQRDKVCSRQTTNTRTFSRQVCTTGIHGWWHPVHCKSFFQGLSWFTVIRSIIQSLPPNANWNRKKMENNLGTAMSKTFFIYLFGSNPPMKCSTVRGTRGSLSNLFLERTPHVITFVPLLITMHVKFSWYSASGSLIVWPNEVFDG